VANPEVPMAAQPGSGKQINAAEPSPKLKQGSLLDFAFDLLNTLF
jgi:hypothetical protein